MGKKIVVYYSQKGSNRFLAEKTAEALNCEIMSIQPRLSALFFLLLASATKLSWGNKKIQKDWATYDSVILCGPIWMGQLISPLRDFVKKYKSKIQKFHFITCCGSSDSKQNDKFGYALVFDKAKKMIGEKMGISRAFPIELMIPEDKKDDNQAMMNASLNSATFQGEVVDRFNNFIGEVKGNDTD